MNFINLYTQIQEHQKPQMISATNKRCHVFLFLCEVAPHVWGSLPSDRHRKHWSDNLLSFPQRVYKFIFHQCLFWSTTVGTYWFEFDQR